MHRTLRNFLKLGAFVLPGVVAVACGSSSSPAGTGASSSSSSSGSNSTTSSASGTTSSSSTSTSTSSTSTSTSSSSGSSITNACENTADGEVLTADPDVASQVVACVLAQSMPTVANVVPCVQQKSAGDGGTGLSTNCATCFAADGLCGLNNCAGDCISDPSGATCTQCLITAGCTPTFATCSGINQSPPDAGTD